MAHHMAYPWDDVMIGSWIASLYIFAKPDEQFTAGGPQGRRVVVHPQPPLREPMTTKVVNDLDGWHDFYGRANPGDATWHYGWDSMCVHKIKAHEMMVLRNVSAIRDEWDNA